MLRIAATTTTFFSAIAGSGAFYSFVFPKFPLLQWEGKKDIYILSKKIRLNDRTPYCQIFYPYSKLLHKEENEKYMKNEIYMRDVAVEGLHRYVTRLIKSFPLWAASFLKDTQHPLNQIQNIDNINLLSRNSNDLYRKSHNNKLPIIIFSHGLGGSAELYSMISLSLAYCGFIVISLESEDGSASYAATVDEEIVPYKNPTGINYRNKEEVENFRKPFLEKREIEIKNILAALRKKKYDPSLNEIFEYADESQIILAGHSFGASSCVNYAQKNPDESIKSMILYDIWPWPLSKECLDSGLSIPSLFINSEQFTVGSKEVTHTHHLIKNSVDSLLVAINGTKHQIFSDTHSFGPKALLDKIYFTGPADVKDAIGTYSSISNQFLELSLFDREPTRKRWSASGTNDTSTRITDQLKVWLEKRSPYFNDRILLVDNVEENVATTATPTTTTTVS